MADTATGSGGHKFKDISMNDFVDAPCEILAGFMSLQKLFLRHSGTIPNVAQVCDEWATDFHFLKGFGKERLPTDMWKGIQINLEQAKKDVDSAVAGGNHTLGTGKARRSSAPHDGDKGTAKRTNVKDFKDRRDHFEKWAVGKIVSLIEAAAQSGTTAKNPTVEQFAEWYGSECPEEAQKGKVSQYLYNKLSKKDLSLHPHASPYLSVTHLREAANKLYNKALLAEWAAARQPVVEATAAGVGHGVNADAAGPAPGNLQTPMQPVAPSPQHEMAAAAASSLEVEATAAGGGHGVNADAAGPAPGNLQTPMHPAGVTPSHQHEPADANGPDRDPETKESDCHSLECDDAGDLGGDFGEAGDVVLLVVEVAADGQGAGATRADSGKPENQAQESCPILLREN